MAASPTELSQADLGELEGRVQSVIRSGVTGGIDLIGYGEITAVIRLDSASGSFACKRLPIFSHREEAAGYEKSVDEYIERLSELGVTVIETAIRMVPQDNGGIAAYCVQPIIDSGTIGPNRLQNVGESEGLAIFRTILDRLRQSVTHEVAPDGQLSNWAFVGDEVIYLDVSTPFLRNPDGSLKMDWGPLLKVAPAPIRPYYRMKLPEVVSVYHELRAQLIDFLANLRKEELDRWIEPFIGIANDEANLDEPITFNEVKKYYNENADTYALLLRIKQADRWFHRNILRRPYPHILPPTIPRNKF